MVPPVVLQGRKYFSAACCMQFSVLCHLVGLGFVFFHLFFFCLLVFHKMPANSVVANLPQKPQMEEEL